MSSSAQEPKESLKIDLNNVKKSPQVPPDSPLLRAATPSSPTSRRARELQREARRARNFRASLDRSGSRSRGATPISSRGGTPTPSKLATSSTGQNEMSFSIKPNISGRKGWKIMPIEEGGVAPGTSGGGEPDPEILQRVIDMIHEMEFSGRSVPERITLKV